MCFIFSDRQVVCFRINTYEENKILVMLSANLKS